MKRQCRFIHLGAAGALALALSSTSWAQSGLPEPKTANGIEYVTGGFGEDGAAAFKQAEAGYPLSLVFAEDAGEGSRPYVADVNLLIKNEAGDVVMEVPAAGPYFLAKLKPGKYKVEATYMGKTQTQVVNVGQGGANQNVMAWKTP